MSFIVDTTMGLSLNGKEVECTVTGRCTRSLTGAIECEPTSVRSEGVELLGVVPNDMLEPMRIRLGSAALAERRGYGDGESAAV